MNIVILMGSPRTGGNTDLLTDAFYDAVSDDHTVEKIRICTMNIAPCKGCGCCFSSSGNVCCQKDDMAEIYEKLSKADMLVIASPVYFYGISSQLKAVVDRLHTPMRNSFHIKKAALFLVGAAEIPDLFDPIIMQYEMLLRFFNIRDCGKILVPGCRDKGDIVRKSPDSLQLAYRLGALLH